MPFSAKNHKRTISGLVVILVISGLLMPELTTNACENKNTTSLRQFRADLNGVLCKPCLKALLDEIKSTQGVRRAKIKTLKVKKNEKKRAKLTVLYSNPPVKKEDLVEIIKFRDLLPLKIEDTKLAKH